MNAREFKERLVRRARRAGLSVPADLAGHLEIYYRLLSTWNRKVNLTALSLDEPTDDAFDRLLIEPLVAARHVPAGVKKMLDVGSGGGSPALPLALALPPGISLLMVESKTRKSVFLREAIRALGLQAADVATARFEELLTRPDLHETHDLVTIRAVRVETRVLLGLQAFLRPGGQIFLFRGQGSDRPESAPPPLVWLATYPLVESLRSRLVVLTKRQL